MCLVLSTLVESGSHQSVKCGFRLVHACVHAGRNVDVARWSGHRCADRFNYVIKILFELLCGIDIRYGII